MPMRNRNAIAKQRDARRCSNLNCASRIASTTMGDFKRCAVNSPSCLGMMDFCCCDSDDFVAETNIPVMRKQLSLGKLYLRKPPCRRQSDLRKPSGRKKYRRPPKFASLQILQEAMDGHFVPFKNGLMSEINVARRNALEICLTNLTLQM